MVEDEDDVRRRAVGSLVTELAREALRRRPDLEGLFASGYADEAIVKRDRFDENVEPIGKP